MKFYRKSNKENKMMKPTQARTEQEQYDFTESLPWYIVIMHSPKTVWKRFLRRLP